MDGPTEFLNIEAGRLEAVPFVDTVGNDEALLLRGLLRSRRGPLAAIAAAISRRPAATGAAIPGRNAAIVRQVWQRIAAIPAFAAATRSVRGAATLVPSFLRGSPKHRPFGDSEPERDLAEGVTGSFIVGANQRPVSIGPLHVLKSWGGDLEWFSGDSAVSRRRGRSTHAHRVERCLQFGEEGFGTTDRIGMRIHAPDPVSTERPERHPVELTNNRWKAPLIQSMITARG